MKKWMAPTVLAWSVAGAMAAAPLTVGIEGRLEVTLPVAGLRAQPPERQAPLNMRIASAKRVESGTLYDLRYIGLVPGRYDLREFLRQADGSAADGQLPPLEVQVAGALPPGKQGLLVAIPANGVTLSGGYRWAIVGAGVVWLLAAIPIFRRRRLAAAKEPVVGPITLTLPERVRRLLAEAAAGRLDVERQAALERMVLNHWSEELKLRALPPAEVHARLREHPQAGVLLRTLEAWLHRPPSERKHDLEALLAAYGRSEEEPREAVAR